MARRRKKHITYDSKETSSFLGLICILAGLFFFISIFTVSEAESNLFIRTKEIFGQSTIVTAIFLTNLGLYLLGTRLPFTKKLSLIGQFALTILVPALLTSFSTTPRELSRLSGSDVLGGHVGYYVVQTIFGDKFPTEPATKFILLMTILIMIPIALSMSVSELVSRAEVVIRWIVNSVKVILIERNEENPDKSKKQKMPEEEVKASTFGDFNKLLTNKKLEQQQKNDQAKAELASYKTLDVQKPVDKLPKKDIDITDVEIKEALIGDEGLKNDELKYPSWKLPPLSLLIPYKKEKPNEPSIQQNARVIEQILQSFDIEAKVEDAFIGPSVVQYALNIPLGINVKKISNLNENIALALGVDSKAVRIESIPETTYLGIEIPRTKRDLVRFKELMDSDSMEGSKYQLPVPIGKDINGEPIIGAIEKMPHLLIAGATGSGKSVVTNSFISSLLMKKTPDELRLILVDPKQVEFSDYNGIPNLLAPVITDMNIVPTALEWAVGEMERRYTILASEQVRNIEGFNSKRGFASMPYIVIVIDEMADMMLSGERAKIEMAIVRLAQKARAVGIHLILATQRPSVNVITGIIKANIPGRIGMSVTSSTDSRVILDRIGAESLMGHGDLLFKAPDKTKSARLQGSFIDQEEVIRVVEFIKSQSPEVEYLDFEKIKNQHAIGSDDMSTISGISENNMLEQAIRIIVQSKKGSASYLQRRLNIGFNRAARLLEELEGLGVVGPANGSKPREVLVFDADEFLANLRGNA